MKKTTSEKLSKRLLKYGAFSAAILGTANASGQIVYTDIADETVDALSTRYAIDLNNDATGDYLFGANGTNFAFIFPAASSMASAYNSNLMVGFNSGAYNYPSNLTAGTVIDGTSPTFAGARGDFNYGSCNYSNSQFCDGMDGYVGFRFFIGADTHYGWARIEVAASGATIIVKDYAYNTTPDEAIEAGQTSLSVDEFSSNTFTHSYNKNTDQLILESSSIPLDNIDLFNILGQRVITKSLSENNEIIDMSGLTDGVYLAKIAIKGKVQTIKILKQ
nr:T9SS type A sorting domain-containing protein [uncultured Psychroserpens sp.]